MVVCCPPVAVCKTSEKLLFDLEVTVLIVVVLIVFNRLLLYVTNLSVAIYFFVTGSMTRYAIHCFIFQGLLFNVLQLL